MLKLESRHVAELAIFGARPDITVKLSAGEFRRARVFYWGRDHDRDGKRAQSQNTSTR